MEVLVKQGPELEVNGLFDQVNLDEMMTEYGGEQGDSGDENSWGAAPEQSESPVCSDYEDQLAIEASASTRFQAFMSHIYRNYGHDFEYCDDDVDFPANGDFSYHTADGENDQYHAIESGINDVLGRDTTVEGDPIRTSSHFGVEFDGSPFALGPWDMLPMPGERSVCPRQDGLSSTRVSHHGFKHDETDQHPSEERCGANSKTSTRVFKRPPLTKPRGGEISDPAKPLEDSLERHRVYTSDAIEATSVRQLFRRDALKESRADEDMAFSAGESSRILRAIQTIDDVPESKPTTSPKSGHEAISISHGLGVVTPTQPVQPTSKTKAPKQNRTETQQHSGNAFSDDESPLSSQPYIGSNTTINPTQSSDTIPTLSIPLAPKDSGNAAAHKPPRGRPKKHPLGRSDPVSRRKLRPLLPDFSKPARILSMSTVPLSRTTASETQQHVCRRLLNPIVQQPLFPLQQQTGHIPWQYTYFQNPMDQFSHQVSPMSFPYIPQQPVLSYDKVQHYTSVRQKKKRGRPRKIPDSSYPGLRSRVLNGSKQSLSLRNETMCFPGFPGFPGASSGQTIVSEDPWYGVARQLAQDIACVPESSSL